MNHANVVRLIDYTYSDAHYLTIPLLAITLADLIDDTSQDHLDVVFRSMSYQAVCGMAYLHWSGISHRDINPRNIMIDWDGTLKFIDFDTAWCLDLSELGMVEPQDEMECTVGTGLVS